MTDPRIYRLADVLVNYSLELQPGEELAIRTSPQADELTLAVYKAALLAGAHPLIFNSVPGQEELFFKYASDEQLDFVSPVNYLVTEKFKAILDIDANHNTRELSAVDPARIAHRRRARKDQIRTFINRMASRDLKWCLTVFPTHSSAQEADMSLADYTEFVFRAGMLDLTDPVAAWKAEGEKQRRLIQWLNGKDQVHITGKDVDLRLSIKGRTFEEASGKLNFPDGEIYTSPVEDSAEGWVRFAYPGIFGGQEVIDMQLWFEGGKVVREQAAKGQELLTKLLDTDPGARFLGEWGIGTNYSIRRFTKDMLFDEKLGGTIHLAVGLGFPEVGGKNESSLHWDMLCDMAQSEIRVDGALFYQDGQFVI